MLIPCPECKRQISEDAASCPTCGRPMTDEEAHEVAAAKQKDQRVTGYAIAAAIAIVLLILAFASKSPSPDRHPPRLSTPTTAADLSESEEARPSQETLPDVPPQSATPITPKRVRPAPVIHDVEYKLACIEAGYRVERTDYRVARFGSLLDSLETKTVNTRSNISDIIVKASQIATREGRPIGVLGVAQALDTSIPPDGANLNLKLEEVAAAWMTLYLEGF